MAGRRDARPPALDRVDERTEGGAGWGTHLPEPAHLWIRFSPRAGRGWRSWPGPERPWMDLTQGGRPVWSLAAGRLPETGGERLDDVLYLPPVVAGCEEELRAIAERHTRYGVPVLSQRLAPMSGEPAEAAATPVGVSVVFDLLSPLLEGDLASLGRVPAGAAAVWPLLPGLTDRPEVWREGCRRLSESGARVVQAVVPALSPTDRRRLAEGRGQEVFQALFHGAAPDPRAFARGAWRYGLAPFLDRPLPRPPLRGRENRRVAGLLAHTAELWHRLGRPAARGQDLFRAAREIDRTSWDLASLARDGNLGVLTWLSAPDRSLVEEALTGRRPALLDQLLEEYLCDEPCSEP